MSMHRIISVLFFTLLLSLCGNGTLQAQGWQERARKEGADYLRQALGGSGQSTQKTTTKKKTTHPPAKRAAQNRWNDQRGGLSNAHAAERLPWPAASSTKK